MDMGVLPTISLSPSSSNIVIAAPGSPNACLYGTSFPSNPYLLDATVTAEGLIWTRTKVDHDLLGHLCCVL